MDPLTIEQCEKNLNSIIFGTFSANTLKHKPKDEITTISLENVFIKHLWGEFFYGQLNMETKKMEKDKIVEHISSEEQPAGYPSKKHKY